VKVEKEKFILFYDHKFLHSCHFIVVQQFNNNELYTFIKNCAQLQKIQQNKLQFLLLLLPLVILSYFKEQISFLFLFKIIGISSGLDFCCVLKLFGRK